MQVAETPRVNDFYHASVFLNVQLRVGTKLSGMVIQCSLYHQVRYASTRKGTCHSVRMVERLLLSLHVSTLTMQSSLLDHRCTSTNSSHLHLYAATGRRRNNVMWSRSIALCYLALMFSCMCLSASYHLMCVSLVRCVSGGVTCAGQCSGQRTGTASSFCALP